MNTSTAHILLIFLDIFTVFCFWMGYHQIQQVIIGISNSSDSVSFINLVGILFVAISLPAFHIFTIFEYIKPSFVARKRLLINRVLVIIGIALVMIAIFISTYTRNYVENAGYYYCDDATNLSVIYKTLVYTKDTTICNQIVNRRK